MMKILEEAPPTRVPWFGARKLAQALIDDVQNLRAERNGLREQLERLGAFTVTQLEARKSELEREIAAQAVRLERERLDAAKSIDTLKAEIAMARKELVATEDPGAIAGRGDLQVSASSDRCRLV